MSCLFAASGGAKRLLLCIFCLLNCFPILPEAHLDTRSHTRHELTSRAAISSTEASEGAQKSSPFRTAEQRDVEQDMKSSRRRLIRRMQRIEEESKTDPSSAKDPSGLYRKLDSMPPLKTYDHTADIILLPTPESLDQWDRSKSAHPRSERRSRTLTSVGESHRSSPDQIVGTSGRARHEDKPKRVILTDTRTSMWFHSPEEYDEWAERHPMRGGEDQASKDKKHALSEQTSKSGRESRTGSLRSQSPGLGGGSQQSTVPGGGGQSSRRSQSLRGAVTSGERADLNDWMSTMKLGGSRQMQDDSGRSRGSRSGGSTRSYRSTAPAQSHRANADRSDDEEA